MLTQLQNPHLICFVAYSGPFGTTQPHTNWLLFCGQEDTLAAEGPGEEEGPGGVWPAGCICCMLATTAWAPGLLGALLEVVLRSERWLPVSAGRQFGLKQKCMGLGCWLRRETTHLVPVCMGRIHISTWLPSLVCPVLLCSLFLKPCPTSSGRGFPWEGEHVTVLGGPGSLLLGR